MHIHVEERKKVEYMRLNTSNLSWQRHDKEFWITYHEWPEVWNILQQSLGGVTKA